MYEAKISVKKRCCTLKKPIFQGKSADLPRYLNTRKAMSSQTLFPAIEMTPVIFDGVLKPYHERVCDRVKLVQHETIQFSHPASMRVTCP